MRFARLIRPKLSEQMNYRPKWIPLLKSSRKKQNEKFVCVCSTWEIRQCEQFDEIIFNCRRSKENSLLVSSIRLTPTEMWWRKGNSSNNGVSRQFQSDANSPKRKVERYCLIVANCEIASKNDVYVFSLISNSALLLLLNFVFLTRTENNKKRRLL